MATSDGKFVWYELMTSDMKAAEAFYTKVLGWDATDAKMPGMNYTLFSPQGASHVGGVMDVPAEAAAMGAKPGWIGYIGTGNVDETATRLKAAGGQILRAPDDIPAVGRFAVVTDPHGAVFCLFSSSSPEPENQPQLGTPGQFGWRELHAGDGPAAFEFYSALFGWTKAEAMDMGAHGVYQIVARAGESFGAIMTKMPQSPKPFWLYYINVANIDEAKTRVETNRGTVINGPMEVPGNMWILQCLDPQGAMFALVGPRK